jgi:hypothetical protein
MPVSAAVAISTWRQGFASLVLESRAKLVTQDVITDPKRTTSHCCDTVSRVYGGKAVVSRMLALYN